MFTISANSLSAGTDTFIVNYSGNATYEPATGTNVVAMIAPTFTLSAGEPAAVASGSSTNLSVNVIGSGNFVGSVTLTCTLTGYPAEATMADLPTCTGGQAVALNSAAGSTAATVNFKVNTTSSTTSELAMPKVGKGHGWADGGAVLAFLVFLGIPARRRSWQAMLGVMIAMVTLVGMTGCVSSPAGQSSTPAPQNSGTTAGSYTFTVTAVSNPSVTPAPTATLTVVVN